MSITTHKLRVAEARRVKHPKLSNIEKHFFLVQAGDVPHGIRTDANAREPVGLNRRVYREVRNNLLGQEAFPGVFDLMNKGITVLAERVKRIDDQNYEVEIHDGQGIVDGGHTYKIICEAQNDAIIPADQYVEIQIRTGIEEPLISEISRGLNTGMQVRQHSLDNLDGKYEWLKDLLKDEPCFGKISWKESDKGEYDIRDLICVLEAMNIFDFPNDSGTHPIQSYEKWSVPAEKFSRDAEEHKDNILNSKYYRIKPILKDALALYDMVRYEFRVIYDANKLGTAAKLDIVEERPRDQLFDFPFAKLEPAKYRLTKGAAFPIFAAFRNKVKLNTNSNSVEWDGGFDAVIDLWKYAAPEICRATKNATEDIGHKPDQLGKNRGHWSNMHKTVELFVLRRAVAAGKKR